MPVNVVCLCRSGCWVLVFFRQLAVASYGIDETGVAVVGIRWIRKELRRPGHVLRVFRRYECDHSRRR